MPKSKTHSGASKRFKVTASGRIKKRSSYMRHCLRKKSKREKQQLNQNSYVDITNMPAVRSMLLLARPKRAKARADIAAAKVVVESVVN